MRSGSATSRLVLKLVALAAAPFLIFAAGTSTQNAAANGDTRTITIFHEHTKETTTATFRVNGSYDSSALKKLNWALRDWRLDEPTEMDPRLFDVAWEVYREIGAGEIHVVSAYRSPQTNAMLRRRSRAVAKNSQHMAGKAMDSYMPGISMSKVREIGMRLQRGGVGYYPTAGHPFVHLDVGSVRHWPKMGYDQLARIFPDGKTVHIPSNGQPMARYEEARAEIERNGGTAYAASAVSGPSRGLFAALFGGGEDDEEEVGVRTTRGGRKIASLGRPSSRNSANSFAVASNSENGDAGGRGFFSQPDVRIAAPVSPARPQPAAAPVAVAASQATTPAAKPQVLASLDPPKADAKPDTKALAAKLEKIEESAKTAEKPQTAADDDDERVAAAVPVPPRRPAGLAAAEIALARVPLPPVRPVELVALASAAPVKSDAGTSLVAGIAPVALANVPTPPALPRLITDGARKPVAANALAFASPASASSGSSAPALRSLAVALRPALGADSVPVPPARTDMIAARLDRANFRALTGDAPAVRMNQSGAGAAAQPMRAGARHDVLSLAIMPESGVASEFSKSPFGDLRTDAFTGPAIKPFATAGAFVEVPTGSIGKRTN